MSDYQYLREWRKKNYARYRMMAKKQHAMFRLKYPMKEISHRLIEKARRKGVLKPQPCVVCGSDKNLVCHPLNYNNPVGNHVWLCRCCCNMFHKNIHRRKLVKKIVNLG